MAKRTDTKVAVLVQVMADLGFDQETIATVTGLPLRPSTTSPIGAAIGLIQPRSTSCGSRRLYLRKFILDDAVALSLTVMKRFEELINGADTMTAATIYSAIMRVTSRMEDGR